MPFLRVCLAQYDYEANTEEELTIKENDVLYILEDDDPEWWKAKLKTVDPNDLHVGLIPSNYVEPLPESGTVVGLYTYEATTEEELSFEENTTLTLYEQDDPDWFLVGNGTHVGFVPGNYVEASAGQDSQAQAQAYEQEQYQEEYPEEQAEQYEQEPQALPEAIPRSNGSASSSAPVEKDDLKFWSVNEVDKKKKKKKGSLGVGNLTIFFGSEEDKSPVRQWSIKDVEKVRQEKKHVYLDLGGSNPASFDFAAQSKQDAEAIFNKIQDSKQKSRISRPATAVATPPSVRDSVVSTSTYQTAQGSPNISSAPLPYQVPEPAYEEPVYEEEQPYVEPAPLCEGRWAIAMFDFTAETEEELSIRENDEVWVTDYVSSEEWWKCQLGDNVGIVPASYIRFEDEPLPEEPPQEEPVYAPQEEAPVQARAVPAPPLMPPAAVATPTPKATETAKRETPAAAATPAPAESSAKKPLKTRMWTDRSGKYKVEAEYLGFHDGKISLHKLNGVKIAVPVREMSAEDVAFVEKMTGQKVTEPGFDWYEFFIKAGIATEDALRYSTIFRTEKMDSSILPDLTRDVLKGLNVKEGDIIRVRKAIGGSGSGSISPDGGSKPKKSVSFAGSGSADVLNDREMAMKLQADEVSHARTSGASLAEQRRQQELMDEQMARELQERENAGNKVPVFGKKNEPQRKNTRPKAATTAPKNIDVSEFTKIGTILSNTPSKSTSSSSSKSKQASSSSSKAANAADLAFDDDAWEVRDPKLLGFDYDNWKVQNRDNEDEWIAKFASTTAPKEAESEEVLERKSSSPKPKDSPAGRPRPGAPGRTDSNNSLSSLGLAAPITPSSPAAAPAAKPATPTLVPGSLGAIALTQAEEAEKVKQQIQKIKEKQETETVKKELEKLKQQQEMLQQVLVQQTNQNQQLVQTIRRMAPPPPVSTGLNRPSGLAAPLVPVNPTGPLRFIPTHPTGQQSQPQFSTASMGLPTMQQQMMTGVNPQMTGMRPVASQATGKASWTNATPANPFGMGAITVNPTGRAPQGIMVARQAPAVPAPFINRNMSQGPPPPPPPPMQTSMATGFNNNNNNNNNSNMNSLNNLRNNSINNQMTGMTPQMTGMNNMAAMNNQMTGMNNNNAMGGMNNQMTGMNTQISGMNNQMTGMNQSPLSRVSQPMQTPQFQTPAMTGMSSMGNMGNNNNNSPQFQSPMMTGMGNNNLSNNMSGMNNNMTGMNNNNMSGMNNLGSGLSSSNSVSSGFNKSPLMSSSLSNNFNSSPMGQSRILQSSSSNTSSFNSGNSFGGMNSNNNNNSLGSGMGSMSSGTSMAPIQSQPTGHLPMASSYMRAPTTSMGGMGSGGMSGGMGGMNNQMTGMNNNQMTGMGGMNSGMGNNSMGGGMGGMNSGMGMGGMNNQMTGMGGMNNAGMGGMNGLTPQMTGMNTNNNMGGMNNMNNMNGGMGGGMNGGMNGGLGMGMGGMNPQMTGMNNNNNNNNMGGMNNNMGGLNNNMGGMNNNMGGMNNNMGGMNNNNMNNNNGQFNRNW